LAAGKWTLLCRTNLMIEEGEIRMFKACNGPTALVGIQPFTESCKPITD
jgi:hypothetical protein